MAIEQQNKNVVLKKFWLKSIFNSSTMQKKRNNFVFIILKISCATLWIVNWLLIPSNNKYARIFFYFLQFRLSSTPTMYGKWLWLKRARMSYFWIKRAYASIECRCDLIRCLNCRFFPSLSPFLSPVRSVACEPFYDVHTFRNMLKIVDVYVCIALIVMMMCLCCVWCTFFHIPHFVPLLF